MLSAARNRWASSSRRGSRLVLRACVDTDMTSGHTLEMLAQNVLMDSKDHNEGVRAFLDRRKPTFTGH